MSYAPKGKKITPLMANLYTDEWRCGGLVVSALDFRSGGRCFEPCLCRRLVSLDNKLYSTMSLFTQVYKWVPETGVKRRPDGPSGSYEDFSFMMKGQWSQNVGHKNTFFDYSATHE